jgi:hypothetical protein
MYKEMKKIVEVRNKHGNGDEILDFADLFFSLASKMLGSAVKFVFRCFSLSDRVNQQLK